jgi:hypothetical protein
LAAVGLVHAPVAALHVPTTWHASLAVHVTGLAPAQVPAWHVSVCVHALPSLHVVPLADVGLEHAPLVGSHVPATWHWSLGVHVTGFVPVQTPAWHESLCVHELPSLHVVPFGDVGLEHAPVAGLHVPATWHWSLAVHVTGFVPVHTPAWHESLCVHELPSLQVVPSDDVGLEHAPVAGLHVPTTWHWSLAVHVTGFEPVHTPAWHESLCVHELPSLHVVPFGSLDQVVPDVDGVQTWHASAGFTVPLA